MYKPVALIGNGCRGNPGLIDYLIGLHVPILTTWMAADLIPEDCPSFCGRPGVLGQRAANIILQKADCLSILGARMDEGQRAFSWNLAPNGQKIVYDIDERELAKFPDTWDKEKLDLSTHQFKPMAGRNNAWLAWCRALYARFRPELDGPDTPHRFIFQLSEYCTPEDVLAVGSSGQAPEVFFQAFRVKKGQRILNLCSLGAMGADVPMAIGACIGSGRRRTICVTGEGGFQLNAQELEVVRRLNLPIIFYVMENHGYGSIRAMQQLRFAGRRTGCDDESGFTTPDLAQLAAAYGIPYLRNEMVDLPGPCIVELTIDPEWRLMPRVMSSNSLEPDNFEDMTPHIDDLAELMAYGNE